MRSVINVLLVFLFAYPSYSASVMSYDDVPAFVHDGVNKFIACSKLNNIDIVNDRIKVNGIPQDDNFMFCGAQIIWRGSRVIHEVKSCIEMMDVPAVEKILNDRHDGIVFDRYLINFNCHSNYMIGVTVDVRSGRAIVSSVGEVVN